MVLTPKQTALAKTATLAAIGDTGRLHTELNGALNQALTVNEAKSALEQLYAYCGFPRSLNALATLLAVVNERTEQGAAVESGRAMSPKPADNELTAVGTRVQTALSGAPVAGPLFDFSPNIDRYLKNHLFGDIFADDVLTHQEREIVTIAALAGMSGVEGQLKAHYRLGRNSGLDEAQIRAIIATLHDTAGKEAAARAQAVFEQ